MRSVAAHLGVDKRMDRLEGMMERLLLRMDQDPQEGKESHEKPADKQAPDASRKGAIKSGKQGDADQHPIFSGHDDLNGERWDADSDRKKNGHADENGHKDERQDGGVAGENGGDADSEGKTGGEMNGSASAHKRGRGGRPKSSDGAVTSSVESVANGRADPESLTEGKGAIGQRRRGEMRESLGEGEGFPVHTPTGRRRGRREARLPPMKSEQGAGGLNS